MSNILFILWFFLPAGIANILPLLVAKIPVLKKFSYPLDFYRYFNKKRILGNHKTLRGIVVGVSGGILGVYVQQYFYHQYSFIHSFVPLNYNAINATLLGVLMGVGALAGDSVKSFIKRQKKIKPGESWFPYDQMDYILGAIVLSAFYLPLSFFHYVLAVILWVLLHLVTTTVAYFIGFKKKPL